MKKTVFFVLLALLFGTSLFAVDHAKAPAKIKVSSTVEELTVFGVSSSALLPTDYTSFATFVGKIRSSITSDVDMLQLGSEVPVGFVSAINNTKRTIMLYMATTALTSDNDRVGIHVRPNSLKIPPAKDSKYGILESSTLSVIETTKGAAVRAPSGTYTATIRVTLVFGG